MTGWRPTVAHGRASIVAVGLVAVALVGRRADLLVIAAPFAVVAAWSVLTRPSEPPTVTDRVGRSTLREGDATVWHAEAVGDRGFDGLVAVMDDARWFERDPAHGAVAVPAERETTGSTAASVEIAVRSTRWGVRTIEPVRLIGVAPWAGFAWRRETGRHRVATLPVPATFDTNAATRPSDGLIGQHRSRRVGEGNEFAAVRPFQPGDRMRRINWIRSARTGELQVNATWADRDMHLTLVIDAADDFGISEGIDGRASSLDLTVRAAGALAEHYAPRGERVSLRTFGSIVARRVPPATGHRQVRRILDVLARLSDDTERFGHRTRARVDRTTVGQLTVMLSPLIAPEALDHAVALGRRGQSVVVVDTLPPDVTVDDDPTTALAWRIRLLERRREVRIVEAAGIPVIPWRGPGSLDQVIRDIARRPTMVRVR